MKSEQRSHVLGDEMSAAHQLDAHAALDKGAQRDLQNELAESAAEVVKHVAAAELQPLDQVRRRGGHDLPVGRRRAGRE